MIINIIEWLRGKKSYIFAALGALAVFAKLVGLIDEATMNTLLALLGFGGLAALKAGQARIGRGQ